MSALADAGRRLFTLASDALSAAVSELRTNARARAGAAALGLIVTLGLGLRGWTYVESRQSEIEGLRNEEKNLLALTSGDQARAWLEADRKSSELLKAARRRLWSDGPVGGAHADFFAWIQSAAAAAGLTNAEIRLGTTRRVGPNGELTEMTVTVTAPSAPTPPSQQSVYALLKALHESPRLIHVRSLRMKLEPVTLFEGEFTAYVPSKRVIVAAKPRETGPAKLTGVR